MTQVMEPVGRRLCFDTVSKNHSQYFLKKSIVDNLLPVSTGILMPSEWSNDMHYQACYYGRRLDLKWC